MVNVHVPSRSKAWPVKTSRGQLWPVETSRCHPSADKPTAITPSSTRGRADGSRVRGFADPRLNVRNWYPLRVYPFRKIYYLKLFLKNKIIENEFIHYLSSSLLRRTPRSRSLDAAGVEPPMCCNHKLQTHKAQSTKHKP
jgi:hypothetical protein